MFYIDELNIFFNTHECKSTILCIISGSEVICTDIFS